MPVKNTAPKASTIKPDNSGIKRDNKTGRFIKGTKPPTTFADRPEDRYDITKDENFNPQHSPRHYLKKFWSMDRDEVKRMINQAEDKKTPITYGEYLALKQADRGSLSSRDFAETLDQAEGKPLQPIGGELDIAQTSSMLDELTIDELRKILNDSND